MKINTFTSLLLAVGLLSYSAAKSQITIDHASFPLPKEDFRMDRQIVQNVSTYKTPTEGANQTWDYTGFETLAANRTTFYISSDTDFPLSYHYVKTYAAFQNYRIASDFHEGFDNEGYFRYGKQQYDTTYSLASVSGNAADEIQFPDAKILFDGKANVVKFPLTYQASWSDTTVINTPYILSVQMFGLNKAPGVHKLMLIFSNEVVGHGTLVLDDENGVKSKEMNVLLVRSQNIQIDSFYLDGSPAPAQLLAAFGITQGTVNESFSYNFYRRDYGDYLMRVGSNGDGPNQDARFINYNGDAIEQVNTSVYSPSTLSIQCYPNPLKVGEILNLSLSKKLNKGTRIQITTMLGREAYSETIQALDSKSNLSLNLPTNLSPGVYNFQLLSVKDEILYTNKLIITE
jgi:hypothetical protein